MKSINLLMGLVIALVATGCLTSSTPKKYDIVSAEVREAAALEKLKDSPNTVAINAKGLCCPSCAIGIRKKVSKLDFVDKLRFNMGVELDAKVQLASVAIAPGKKADILALTKAVDDAGYLPHKLYKMENGQLKSTPLIAPSE